MFDVPENDGMFSNESSKKMETNKEVITIENTGLLDSSYANDEFN